MEYVVRENQDVSQSFHPSAEFMKPLATPVLGGMVSSLLHVLIVTPVIFTTFREWEVKKRHVTNKGEINESNTAD